jgi:hypothetical protein
MTQFARSHGAKARPLVIAAVLAVALAGAASAQFRGRLPEGRGVPPRYPTADFEDGAFTVCKLEYTSVTREPEGAGWSTDYPYAGINLMTRLSELTRTPVSLDERGEPNYWVVTLNDPALFHCPFLIASDVGTMGLTGEEALNLRDYLLKGGFLWVDDFWGTPAWEQWSAQIYKALPEYRIVDVPGEHALLNAMFRIREIPQVTNIGFWRRTGGATSERGPDSPRAYFRMIADESGRAMVVMTHNSDIGDSWEREGEDRQFFLQFSPNGYSLGINVLLYVMSH